MKSQEAMHPINQNLPRSGSARIRAKRMKIRANVLIRKWLPTASLHIRAYEMMIRDTESYLYKSGWMRSIDKYRADDKDQMSDPILATRKPMDHNGDTIPWMNFAIVNFLRGRLKKDFHMFEFGSGHSTIWYAALVKSVTSLEHDPSWYESIKEDLPNNVQLLYQESDTDGNYCRMAATASKENSQLYDVIVVDGKDRVNCIIQSIAALSPRGVILLDDSQRQGYQPGIQHARGQGFRQLDFEGIRAASRGNEQTTILYRDGNCLEI